MKAFLIFSIFLLKSYIIDAQVSIQSAYLYNYFPTRGFTTAGLSTQFKELKENQEEKILLSLEDIALLEKIINRAKAKKHFQTKTGGGACFGQFLNKSQTIDVIILSNLIIDLTNYVNYWIKDEKDQFLLSEFVLKVKKENEKK